MTKKTKHKAEQPILLQQALKDSRLAANFSVEDIAQKLNLKVTVIRDIEDNLEQIIIDQVYPQIYLRGYLANFGKIVDLSDIESFPQYQELIRPEKSATMLKSPHTIQHKKGVSKEAVGVLFLLLLVFIISALYFGFSSIKDEPSQVELPSETDNRKMRLPNSIGTSASSPTSEKTMSGNNGSEPLTEKKQHLNVGAKVAITASSIEPTATKPVVTEAVVIKPAAKAAMIKSTTKPVAIKPAVTQPTITKAAVIKPAVTQSTVNKAAVIKPAVIQSTVNKAAVIKPAVTQSTANKAAVIKPAVTPSTVNKAAVIKPAVTPSTITKAVVIKPATKPTAVKTVATEADVTESTITKLVDTEVAGIKQTLILKFKDECWTEIFDANGERLAFNLYKPGRELTLAGTPPFNLKLGNPLAVDVFYQDKLIEKKYREGRTANFSVPK